MMNVSEANAANTVLVWAMATATGKRPVKNGTVVTDEMATEAAKLLAARASRTLMAGLRPDDVELRSPGRPEETGAAATAAEGSSSDE